MLLIGSDGTHLGFSCNEVRAAIGPDLKSETDTFESDSDVNVNVCPLSLKTN